VIKLMGTEVCIGYSPEERRKNKACVRAKVMAWDRIN
jgi:hypothetical protein